MCRVAVDNNDLPDGRTTSGRAPSKSRPSPATGVDGPHVTGINKNTPVSCTAECMSDLPLMIVALVQALPVYMASVSSFQPYPITCRRNFEPVYTCVLCTSGYLTG